MNHMKFESPDMTAQNIDRIAALFPNCVTEMPDENGKIKRAINFELLKQMLSPDVVDGDEAYEFTWVGKKAAIVEANKPIRKTLRPVLKDETIPTGADSEGKPYCSSGSKDWDTTENLYIEGDNLEVLKLLQESYLGKVKMIYIDPPYNTGNDFIYADDFMRSQEEENEQMGMYDEDENRLFKNTDTNGRFHSDWCSMIYSRLMLARNLLTDDGVIFISIDDNEQENLKKICDEVFGGHNFIAQIVWQKRTSPDARRIISAGHEYVFAYVKDETLGHSVLNALPFDKDDYARYKNPDNDPNGPWISTDCTAQGGHGTKEQFYDLVTPAGRVVKLQEGLCWRYTKRRMDEEIAAGHIWFGADGKGVPRKKTYLADRSGKTMWTWWPNSEVGHTQEATKEVSAILGQSGLMDFPKPLRLMKRMVSIATENDSIILDFFSGSATTAHAVMQLNAEDGGHRKFIMVQLPEKCDETSEAYKAGYKNICEIGKERIRRAGDKIKSESPMTTQDLDIGFRVLKLDDTNMKDVYYAPDDYDQGMLAGLESNIKDDRTDLDLLFGCLIDWGLPLSLPYKSEQLGGCTVHTYNDGDLIACFEANIPESVVKEIAQRKPLRAVFRDSGFASSPEKINVFEIFKLYMPEDANDISKRVRVI